MQITVERKNVYGNERIYPVCEQAKLFASLTGDKTLSPQALKTIKELGYTVAIKQTQLEW